MNWQVNRVIYRASYESESFTFEAFSTEELHARACLVDVLTAHGTQYGCQIDWWRPEYIEVRRIELGVGYRDMEPIYNEKESA